MAGIDKGTETIWVCRLRTDHRDMSTNDTILTLANGTSGIAEITSADSIGLATNPPTPPAELAQPVVRDDEGKTISISLYFWYELKFQSGYS